MGIWLQRTGERLNRGRQRFWPTLAAAVLAGWLIGPAAAADPLDDARAAGVFGEARSGYVELVGNGATPDDRALRQQINAKRRQTFETIARKNGITVDAAGQIMHVKIIELLPAGSFYEGPGGGWVRR